MTTHVPLPDPIVRSLAVLAAVAAFAMPSGAQGPALPADPRPPVAELSVVDGAKQLAANVARMNAAGAPQSGAWRTARPFAAWRVSARSFRDSILVSIARTAIGTRYVRGGQSFEAGFDCSGLVRYVMSALKVAVPRTAAQQAGAGLALGRDPTRLRPGDLLTFGRASHGVSHVGIYLGNGRYVHASSVAGQVIESALERGAALQVKPWRGSRRLLSDTSADSTLKGDS